MTALALTPATLDLTVVQGDSFAESLTFGQSGSALNLSTYTALAQVRAEKSATSTLRASGSSPPPRRIRKRATPPST